MYKHPPPIYMYAGKLGWIWWIGNFVENHQIKNLPILFHALSHYAEMLAITKFKVQMTDSPIFLMLTKVSHYTVCTTLYNSQLFPPPSLPLSFFPSCLNDDHYISQTENVDYTVALLPYLLPYLGPVFQVGRGFSCVQILAWLQPLTQLNSWDHIATIY